MVLELDEGAFERASLCVWIEALRMLHCALPWYARTVGGVGIHCTDVTH